MLTYLTHRMNKRMRDKSPSKAGHAIATAFCAVTIFTASCLPVSASATSAWQAWPAIGDASLTWGPWVIYDSELRSPSGTFRSQDQDLALVIKYQRDIDKDDLIEATDDQWRHLGISRAKRDKWLRTLEQIWPDVKKGDRLIYVLQQEQGRFYRDNRQIGVLNDKEMSQSFMHIWLSPNTSYPTIRQQLIGMKK
ncbi:chalcone isomerase family protein [Photobacterium japonica]|uniref:chalcone isomerase family protein n=1 Tax=Photobacterium japonica TaxID=2910235 RepID=UPI003D13A61A